MKAKYFSILLFYYFLQVRSKEIKGVGSAVQSWSYVTVRERAHYFWWLYYASSSESSWKNKPLLISLTKNIQKGASGLNNFDQIGPLDIDLKPRNSTWLNDFNILFIDNILGTGFSYASSETTIEVTKDQMISDTFKVIKHFFSRVPEFRSVPTYLMCQNVGTVIAAEAALTWAQAQEKKQIDSNLKAVILGTPWISLLDVVNFWAAPSNKNKFKKEEFKQIENKAKEAREAIEQDNYWNLFESFASQVFSVVTFWNLNNLYNLSPNVKINYFDDEKENKLKKLMNGHVKNILKLNHKWAGGENQAILVNFGEKTSRPIKDTFDQLLGTNIKVIVIAGEYDVIIPAPSVESWVNNFNWANKDAFQQTKQTTNGGISVKKYGNLEYYLIKAGHLLMTDNPQDMKKIVLGVTQE